MTSEAEDATAQIRDLVARHGVGVIDPATLRTIVQGAGLLGASDVAERMGVSKQRVNTLHKTTDRLPEVLATSAGPLWLAVEVDAMLKTYRQTKPGPRPKGTRAAWEQAEADGDAR